jgi:hypothetical protein
MRHVGDETSLELLQRTPSVKFEGSVGTLVRRKYVYRPVSYEARQEVAACVAARKKTRAAKK